MIKTLYLLPLILCFTVYKIKAQSKHIISGYIRDAQTGELLIGTTIRAEGIGNLNAAGNNPGMLSTATNDYGFYSLTAADGT